MQTAIENGLNPQAYLEYIFKQIQLQDTFYVEKLFPWSEEIPVSCKMPVKKS
ncbi:transposase domain-containing protein [Sporomusa sp. KB1]|uniref:transposase domain-containing protein n=1 Tax=Sporomusa sp. KB1 TaxID=943346 RepID=UPI00351B429D